MKRIAIVAGEKSGDSLGAEIVAAIQAKHPNAEFVGLAGPLMQKAGVKSLAEMDKISIMGFDGLLSSLREILAIRKKLYTHFIAWQPDVFIGIDVPDFNLGLEIKLKRHNIPIAHCVSPTVWAWRGGRIKKIKRAINVMLALFPFEAEYYKSHRAPVVCIGHPLAKQVREWTLARDFVEQVPKLKKWRVAVLPGSRMSEVSRLAHVMFSAASLLKEKYHDIEFVVPAANAKLHAFLLSLPEYQGSHIHVVDGYSRDVLASCDLAVLASGTAALEAALFAKPMVVLYKVSKFTAWYAGRTMQVAHYSMPNHLTSPPAVREFVQEQANPANVVAEVSRLIDDPEYYQAMHSALAEIAPSLDLATGELVCDALERLAENKHAFETL